MNLQYAPMEGSESDTDFGMIRKHADVGALDKLAPASERSAIDCRDDGFVECTVVPQESVV